jgi:hypothetical protein
MNKSGVKRAATVGSQENRGEATADPTVQQQTLETAAT